ncbi:MAG: PepSY domain-containing protein [Steroidobacteraceae bacterium]
MFDTRLAVKRLLIQSHRWLGIVLGLVIVVWFASGIAMIYVGGMPQLTPQARLDHLPVLDVSRVRLTPAHAAARRGAADAGPGTPRLLMIQGRPAYRFPFGGNATVFADDGSLPAPLDEAAATQVAQQFLGRPAPLLRLLKRVDTPDQWTLSLRGAFPLLKYAVGDAKGTQVYVSVKSAEVVLATTRADRARAWIATIPHWLYFSALRQNQPLWYRIVVALSALACVMAALGLVLAFTQWRRTRPLDLKRSIPYRGGMRWHYISGALFGVFALTWAFSGLLSMEPFAWTNVPELAVDRDALTGGAPELARYENIDATALPALAAPLFIKEVGYARIHGEYYLRLHTSSQADAQALPRERLHAAYGVGGAPDGEILVEAATLARRNQAFDSEAILKRLRAALPGVPVIAHELLHEYDDYYYSRSDQLALPVLRLKLGDALRTWLYVDPRTSELVANVHRYSRVERWLYSGLHSLDFRFWYAKRPLWDLAMLTLLLGGLVGSSLGLYYGITRLAR